MSAETLQALGIIAVAAIVVGLWQWLRRSRFVSEPEVRRCLAAGAPVIDVRTPEEFAAGHLPGALNLPLDTVVTRIRTVAPDPERPLLLHCRSGGRSGIARMLLRRAGYTDVHNLGSIERAERLVHLAREVAGPGDRWSEDLDRTPTNERGSRAT